MNYIIIFELPIQFLFSKLSFLYDYAYCWTTSTAFDPEMETEINVLFFPCNMVMKIFLISIQSTFGNSWVVYIWNTLYSYKRTSIILSKKQYVRSYIYTYDFWL